MEYSGFGKPKWMQPLAKAREALETGPTDGQPWDKRTRDDAQVLSSWRVCKEYLDQARRECFTDADRQALYGHRSVLNHPTGIAELAEYRARDKHDYWSAFYLLDYVEMQAGTGFGLCEIWFEIYSYALIQVDLPTARAAYDRCLGSQAKGPIQRIQPERLESAFRLGVWDDTKAFESFLKLAGDRPRPYPD